MGNNQSGEEGDEQPRLEDSHAHGDVDAAAYVPTLQPWNPFEQHGQRQHRPDVRTALRYDPAGPGEADSSTVDIDLVSRHYPVDFPPTNALPIRRSQEQREQDRMDAWFGELRRRKELMASDPQHACC